MEFDGAMRMLHLSDIFSQVIGWRSLLVRVTRTLHVVPPVIHKQDPLSPDQPSETDDIF